MVPESNAVGHTFRFPLHCDKNFAVFVGCVVSTETHFVAFWSSARMFHVVEVELHFQPTFCVLIVLNPNVAVSNFTLAVKFQVLQ